MSEQLREGEKGARRGCLPVERPVSIPLLVGKKRDLVELA